MSVILGSGDFQYRVAEAWGELPTGWKYGDVAAVGVDRNDNVYVFNPKRSSRDRLRSRRPLPALPGVKEYFRGRTVCTWAPTISIYPTDDGDHTVRKCSLDGKVLLTIGVPGRPSDYMSGQPFHRCTHTALSPAGDIYVADGYGNAQVHKYSPAGKLLHSWGESGSDPGQFNIVHNVCCDDDGWVYVADRENHRIQVFDGNGKYEAQWVNLHRPCGLYMPPGKCQHWLCGRTGTVAAGQQGGTQSWSTHHDR